ncbi:hypothetical protein HKD37_18G050475 [Glycine soja]
MRKLMEVKAATIVVASIATERDLIHPSGFNQDSRPVSDVNIYNSPPIFIENQQPQPDHNYAHVSQPTGAFIFWCLHVECSGGPQYRPPPQPLHFMMGIEPPAILARSGSSSSAPDDREREMITMILDTLPVFYCEKMIGYISSSFADLVFVSKRIEASLRKGKFNYVAYANPGNGGLGRSDERKKEGEPHVVATLPTWPNFPLVPYNPIPNTTPNTNQNTNQGRNFLEKKPVEFTQSRYNLNVTCAYHGGVLEHSIEPCMTLKHKVQSLIDAGWLRYKEENHL